MGLSFPVPEICQWKERRVRSEEMCVWETKIAVVLLLACACRGEKEERERKEDRTERRERKDIDKA